MPYSRGAKRRIFRGGGVMAITFLKKGEEKIKMKSQKPHKHRLRDSERLY